METEFVLPFSGKKVSIRRGKGIDWMRAQRQVIQGGKIEPGAVSMALIAELATIDGKQIVFEDVLEMDLEDLLALQGKMPTSANFENPPPSTSRPSSDSDSQRQN